MQEKVDSIFWIENNVVTGEQIEWIYDEDEFGNRTNFKMNKVGDAGLIVVEIKNDTMLLRDIGTEPFLFHLSRLNLFE